MIVLAAMALCAVTVAAAKADTFTPVGKPPEDPKPTIRYDAEKNVTEIVGQSARFEMGQSKKPGDDKDKDKAATPVVDYVTFHFRYSYEGTAPQAPKFIQFQFQEVTSGGAWDTDDIYFRFGEKTKTASLKTSITPGQFQSTVLFEGRVPTTTFREMAAASELSFRFADRERVFVITEPFMAPICELAKTIQERK